MIWLMRLPSLWVMQTLGAYTARRFSQPHYHRSTQGDNSDRELPAEDRKKEPMNVEIKDVDAEKDGQILDIEQFDWQNSRHRSHI